jgi:hypothetical protein
MLRYLMTGLAAATLVIVVAGCSSTTSTPRWGYGGPPPLFAYLDGYVEDQTASGPYWRHDTNVPGSGRITIANGQATYQMTPPPLEGTMRLYQDNGKPTLYMDDLFASFHAVVTKQQ